MENPRAGDLTPGRRQHVVGLGSLGKHAIGVAYRGDDVERLGSSSDAVSERRDALAEVDPAGWNRALRFVPLTVTTRDEVSMLCSGLAEYEVTVTLGTTPATGCPGAGAVIEIVGGPCAVSPCRDAEGDSNERRARKRSEPRRCRPTPLA